MMHVRSTYRQFLLITLIVGGVVANLSAISLWGKHRETVALQEHTQVLSAIDEDQLHAASGIFADVVQCITDPELCRDGVDMSMFETVDFSNPESARSDMQEILFTHLKERLHVTTSDK